MQTRKEDVAIIVLKSGFSFGSSSRRQASYELDMNTKF